MARLRDVVASAWQVRTVYVACAISLVLGLFFLFVWSPHPWGWQGIDHYHERALSLARGEDFGTTDVPWGYAYFLAAVYAIGGERLWPPLVIQVGLNALIPLLLYKLVRPIADQPTAVLAALLTGVLSFNTVYATTQSSDAICTVLFMFALLCLARAWTSGKLWLFAITGLLLGVVPQFRPNMILFPPLAAALVVLIGPNRGQALRGAVVLMVCMVLPLIPWTVRNYRLTGELMPTSSHGGVQLWYGTLQTGKYLNSRAYNPRSAFEAPAFDYTSVTRRPIVITAARNSCSSTIAPALVLTYWTDRSQTPVRVEPIEFGTGEAGGAGGESRSDNVVTFTIPAQPSPTTVYYSFEARDAGNAASPVVQHAPVGGVANPGVFFVSTDHLGDIDTHGDLLDVFDVVRLVRMVAWNEPPAFSEKLDLDGDGRLSEGDLRTAVDRLLAFSSGAESAHALSTVDVSPESAVVRLADGSTLRVDRQWHGLVTDLVVNGKLAGVLLYTRMPFTALAARSSASEPRCPMIGRYAFNEAFYVREPHQMRRYTALAFDNIKREPVAFVLASLARIGQLFVIRGSSDVWTAQQFSGSTFVYAAGFALSATYFLAFLAGVWIVWRRRQRGLLLLVVPIAYVPLTICFVLTNMRYTVTMQPLVFVFVAVTVLAVIERERKMKHVISRSDDRVIE